MKHNSIIKKLGSLFLLSSFVITPAALSLGTVTQQTVNAAINYTESDLLTTTDDEAGWNSSISYANDIKNSVQAKYTSADRTAVEFQNSDFSAVYNLRSNKLVSEFKNKNGQSYFTNSLDAYVEYPDGMSYASESVNDTYFNIFRLGYYYYDVHILGQGIVSGSTDINTSNSYNILSAARRSWRGNDVTNISAQSTSLSYVVSSTYDPYCYNTNISFPTASYNAIQITIQTQKATSCQLYFYTEQYGGFNADQQVSFSVTPGQKNTYTVPLNAVPGYSGNVKGIRIDCGMEGGEKITVSSMKAVYATHLVPSIRLERTFHTFSNKLHEELRFIATENVSNITSVGVQTKIPTSSVSKYIVGDGQTFYSSISDSPSKEYTVVAFDTAAGVLGYVVPSGDGMGAITVEISDGYYVINRYLPLTSIDSGADVRFSSRIYNDMTHDFSGFIKQAYMERNPLPASNIQIGKSFDTPSYEGYDPFTGTYVFNVHGESFNGAYYGRPNYHFQLPITITGDNNDRRIYIRAQTSYGSLECGAVVSGRGELLPIPVEVCKNFCGEVEEPIYYPNDVAYGEVYFPLTIKSNETKFFTVVHLYQNWGQFALKQLSSIQFFAPYYHLSVGVTETNCIAPYFVMGKDAWTLPDFRALSSDLWTDQPQHYSGGHIFFLKYTDSEGNSYKSESQSAQIHSAGPLYADIDMDYLSDDGKIKAEYKHVELPHTDETRTYYQIKLTVLEDVSIADFKRDFSFVAFDGRHVLYTKLSYLDANGNVANKTLSYNTSTVDYLTLGKNAPFFCYYLRQGSSNQVVNMALVVKNSDITINGKKYDGNFILKNTYLANMNYGALTLDLGAVTLKKGDEMIINTVLLPWGNHDETQITSVLNVRNDSALNPYKLSVTTGTDISEEFVPSVLADNGNAEFTISGGTNNTIVRVYGFDHYAIDGIYELVNGEYVKYDTSYHNYDGYQVYYDEDGTYSFAFIFDMSSGTPRTFKVIQGMKGDINGDNVLDSRDILRFKKYLSAPETVEIRKNIADINGDDVIDVNDYNELLKLFN